MTCSPCQSCKFMEVYSKKIGYCHLLPPTVFFQRLVKLDGNDRIDPRTDAWMQLMPAAQASTYPSVYPPAPGCSYHRTSLRTIWRYRKAEDIPLQPVFKQEKP